MERANIHAVRVYYAGANNVDATHTHEGKRDRKKTKFISQKLLNKKLSHRIDNNDEKCNKTINMKHTEVALLNYGLFCG